MSNQTRPPVITIMGHVDHGKTSLLDYIRKTNVAARESGGITQHIGAYQIEFQGKKLTFIDTPGHAAFNKMRERGAHLTDIVVLVVAADDGVKPQTIESIRHIKASNVSVIVAINKSDLKNVYADVVKGQLVEHGILVNGFGGSIDAINVSAKTGAGVDELLDTLVAMAELSELKADPAAPLEAVVIESTLDPQRGAVASVIVQQGTLKVRQDVYADDVMGRVRSLVDENGKQLSEVLPGSPAEIIGMASVPAVGSVIRDQAAQYPEPAEDAEGSPAKAASNPFSLDSLLNDKPKLKLIVKADVEGTLEAILQNFDEESVELLTTGVGPVTEGDIELAQTSGAVILAFRVKVHNKIKEQAKTVGVKIKAYDVIYQLIEDLQKQMLKLMEPTIDEVITGEAEILQIFEMRGERIAGVRVKTGEIKKNDLLHLKRGDEMVANPVIKSMMHGKEEILILKTKNEGGLTFKNKSLDFRVGDTIVAYKLEDEG
ncbi:MAG TPA: translation initiation factor IF-2 [Vitreimonas sp.]|nr:translation initiation factor IF-2 [Vitreimonas sp.]